jgi:hypothetical protein
MDPASLDVSKPARRLMGQNKTMIMLFLVCTVNIFQTFDLVLFVGIKIIKQTAAGMATHSPASRSENFFK